MEVKKAKCPRCGNLNFVLPSNNPLVEGICISCINSSLDAAKVEHFAFFCRTYNIPFDPDRYMKLYQKYKQSTFIQYIETLIDTGELKYEDKVSDLWKKVEEEWSKIKTYQDLVLRIEEIRMGFEERARLKWGPEYSFAELIQLENLMNNTIKAYNITDPMRLDAIKKAAKISVKIDALIESGEAKVIKDYASVYQSFLKSANIEELSEVANEGTIQTVADLYKYMEKNGFEFTFYDKEDRDIVDRTMKDIKASISEQVRNASGLDTKMQEIAKAFKTKMEDEKTEHALAITPLEDLVAEDYYEEVEMEVDSELESEDLDFDYDD